MANDKLELFKSGMLIRAISRDSAAVRYGIIIDPALVQSMRPEFIFRHDGLWAFWKNNLADAIHVYEECTDLNNVRCCLDNHWDFDEIRR